MAALRPTEPAVPVDSVEADDPIGIVLYGAVQDQDGNPLPDWLISLTAADPGSTLDLRTSGGRFPARSPAGIPPGIYRLCCQSSGLQTIDEEVTLSPRVQRRDFRLLRSLAIKVRFDVPERQRAPPLLVRSFGLTVGSAKAQIRIP